MASMAPSEELAKQVLNSFIGLEERLRMILEGLPADRVEYWKDRFSTDVVKQLQAVLDEE